MMFGAAEGGAVMPDEAAAGEKSTPALRTLADKVNWLIDRAHPAGRGPFSNNEVAALIESVTGEEVSYTTIWKLRNGQAQNPQKRLIEALELLALVRDARIGSAQLRAILELSPQARQAIADLVQATARDNAPRHRSEQDDAG
jgi:hypothetical protein